MEVQKIKKLRNETKRPATGCQDSVMLSGGLVISDAGYLTAVSMLLIGAVLYNEAY